MLRPLPLRSDSRPVALALGLLVALLGAPAPARAQNAASPTAPESAAAPAGPSRQTLAQTLFDEARALYERGSYPEACDKFQASHDLDPKGGTLFNVALCREKQGRVATAWTAYAEAKNLSAREGRRDRVTFAESKIKDLEPALPRLRIVVTDPRGEGASVSVTVDGVAWPAAAWSTAVPVDPGVHLVAARAPGRSPFSERVAASSGQAAELTVPVLARVAPTLALSPAQRPVPATAADTPKTRAVLGWTLVGVGAAGLGVGSFLGVTALHKRDEAETQCRAGRCAEGEKTNDDASRAAWGSNIAFGLGAAAVVAGVVVLIVSSQ